MKENSGKKPKIRDGPEPSPRAEDPQKRSKSNEGSSFVPDKRV